MANKLYEETVIQDIADATKELIGDDTKMVIAEIPPKIRSAIGGGGGSGSASLNIHYGDTAPSDTSKLWCKCAEPSNVLVKGNIIIGDATVTTLTETISARSAMASAKVGNKIYLFGGYDGSARTNTIQVFDTEKNTHTVLSTTLPKTLGMASACAIGTIIYIFGGQVDASTCSRTVYRFDTETETISKLSDTLSDTLRGVSACAVDKDIYIFGGDYRDCRSTIQVFDSETNSISVLSTTLPIAMRSISTVRLGEKIYLFGGYDGSSYVNTINVFDIRTNAITTLSEVLPFECITYASAIGKNIYLLGGETSDGRKDTIMKFDSETETLSTLSTVLPTSISSISVEAIGMNIYIFGGYTGTYSNNIYKFSLSLELEHLKMLLHSSLSENIFNIMKGDITIETGVKTIYLGNTDGQAELVDAYLYQNEAWTQI